jgi:hypothetical protein
MPLAETIKLAWNGHKGTVNYQPKQPRSMESANGDPNGAEQVSSEGWYFTDDSGNSSKRYADCSDAIEVGIRTLEARS